MVGELSYSIQACFFEDFEEEKCGNIVTHGINKTIITNETTLNNTSVIKEFDIKCNETSPCHCRGSFCIKGDYCNAGVAFWKGKPICGQNWGGVMQPNQLWMGCDDLFCKGLGFKRIAYWFQGYNGK